MTSWQRGEVDSLTLGRQRMAVATGDGEAVRLALSVDAGKLRAPPVKMKAPKGAMGFGDPSGMVDSARAATHWCGGELHTVARILTIVN
jgi:hypothetical protein